MPFEAAPFGVTGLETAFAALYTHLVEPGLVRLETLLERMSAGPARIFGLEPAARSRSARRRTSSCSTSARPGACARTASARARRTRGCSASGCTGKVAADGRRGPVASRHERVRQAMSAHEWSLRRSRTATVFAGESVGAAAGYAFGEAVFTTAMTGYQEVVTDPSFCGQIVCFTAPMVGNYGVADAPLRVGAAARARRS